MLKNIGIVGNGFVGKAVKELISKCKMIFLCLPTPMNLDDGSCHLGILENTLEEINDWCDEMEFYGLEQRTIIIKSTIQPGTTEKWNKIYKKIDIAFNPEFLTEANSIEDFKNQNRIIIGSNRKVGAKIKSIYSKVFPKVPIIKTSSTIAEMIKYFTNCFLAMKVSYANEIYQICEKLDIDYDKVVEYAVRDERIGASHLNVPGPDGDFGFGGHCFPKDLNALIHLAEKQGLSLDINVLKAVLETNNKVRTDRDWEQQEGRAVI
jgi:nucleotide sugar dehydrogenase